MLKVFVGSIMNVDIEEYYKKGMQYYRDQKYRDALNQFKKICKYYENKLKIKLDKDYQNKELLNKKIKKLHSKDVELFVKSWNNRGYALKNLGKYKKALECFETALKIQPNNIYALNGKSAVLIKLIEDILNSNKDDKFIHEYVDEVIECSDRVLKVKSNNIRAYFIKGKALYYLSDYDRSIACFNEIIRYYKNKVVTKFDKSYKKLMNNLKNLNAEDMEIFILSYLFKGRILKSKGLESSKRKYYERSIECFDEAIRICGNLLELEKELWENITKGCNTLNTFIKKLMLRFWIEKGNIFKILEKYNEAIECFNKAIKYYEKFLGMALDKDYNNLLILKENGNFNEKDIKEFANLWFNKGCILGRLENLEEAIECFNKALQIDVNNIRIWNKKGYTLRNLGKYKEALECFETALKIQPNNSVSLTGIGYVYYSLGDYKKAIEYFDKSLANIKNNIEIEFKVYGLNGKGYANAYSRKYDKALRCFEEALKIKSNPYSLNGIAHVLSKKDNYEEAVEYLEKAYKEDQNFYEVIKVIYEYLEKEISDNKKFEEIFELLRKIAFYIIAFKNKLMVVDKKQYITILSRML